MNEVCLAHPDVDRVLGLRGQQDLLGYCCRCKSNTTEGQECRLSHAVRERFAKLLGGGRVLELGTETYGPLKNGREDAGEQPTYIHS